MPCLPPLLNYKAKVVFHFLSPTVESATKEPFYMVVDEQFRDWWENCLEKPPILQGWFIPILKKLQGHPEAPRLWHKHIDGILIIKVGFQHKNTRSVPLLQTS
jgi:hypothetical protein